MHIWRCYKINFCREASFSSKSVLCSTFNATIFGCNHIWVRPYLDATIFGKIFGRNHIWNMYSKFYFGKKIWNFSTKNFDTPRIFFRNYVEKSEILKHFWIPQKKIFRLLIFSGIFFFFGILSLCLLLRPSVTNTGCLCPSVQSS